MVVKARTAVPLKTQTQQHLSDAADVNLALGPDVTGSKVPSPSPNLSRAKFP